MRYGSNIDPPNPFDRHQREKDLEHVADDLDYLASLEKREVIYLDDDSQSIVSQNQSPDVPFRYSINPYRGCLHGCSYCYARPGHEYLNMNAGLDFETKIMVKRNAPALFRQFLRRKNWRPEPITFSGVTDCYQPIERQLELTRKCLEIAVECRQPVSIITKNALITRDQDLLESLAADRLVHVYLSITTLQPALAAVMEPKTSTPVARLRTLKELSQRGIPVGVMVAPVIPGLNDSEIPQILQAAAEAGAQSAGYVLLRLPTTVEPVFLEWLQRTHPDQASKILHRIEETRGGKRNDASWDQRMSGQGLIAQQIRSLFQVFRRKTKLDQTMPSHNCDSFQPPAKDDGQLRLF